MEKLLEAIAMVFPFAVTITSEVEGRFVLKTFPCTHHEVAQRKMSDLCTAIGLNPEDRYPSTYAMGQLVNEDAHVESIVGDMWFRLTVAMDNLPWKFVIECDRIEDGFVSAVALARVLNAQQTSEVKG